MRTTHLNRANLQANELNSKILDAVRTIEHCNYYIAQYLTRDST